MGKKMIFTGFDDNSSALGSFTVGHVYIALDDDSSEYPDNTSLSDGNDAFFVDDNGEGFWEYLTAFRDADKKPKLVRPAMTPEARDILNSIHETVGEETRSDSIVEFMSGYTDMGVELCAATVASLSWERRFKHASKSLANERKKVKGWMIYSAIVAAYAIGISVYCLIGG